MGPDDNLEFNKYISHTVFIIHLGKFYSDNIL